MYILRGITVGTMGYSIDSLDVFLVITCEFRDLVNLCIGVATRFRLDSLVETLGAIFEVLCVGLNR